MTFFSFFLSQNNCYSFESEIDFVFLLSRCILEEITFLYAQDFLPFPDLPRAVSSFAVTCSARSRNARHARKRESGREKICLEKILYIHVRFRRERNRNCIA